MDRAASILEPLDPGQRKVVLHDKGPMLATAVAGAGKTTAIVARMDYLITVRGVDPNRILAVTFSVKGAEEMASRLRSRLVNTGKAMPRIGTFHSVAWEVVRTVQPDRWTIDDTGRYGVMVKEVVGHKGMRWIDADPDLICDFIGVCKANLIGADDVEPAHEVAARLHFKLDSSHSSDPERLCEAYQRAEELRKDARLLTFDDQLVEAAKLLRPAGYVRPEPVRDKFAARWDYLIQDEAQDQNLAQAVIGEALAHDHRNYLLVGDPSQTIFGWRGADPGGLEQFARGWGAERAVLDFTYRCGREVTTLGNSILERIGSSVRMHSKARDVDEVVLMRPESEAAEAEQVALAIQEDIGRGYKPRDLVVLYRTGEQSHAVEDWLIKYQIPYRVVGGISFFERREILQLLSYLRLAAGCGGEKDVERTLKAPFRYRSREVIKKVCFLAVSRGDLGWQQIADEVKREHPKSYSLDAWARLLEELAEDAVDEDPRLSGPGALLKCVNSRTNFVEWIKKSDGDDTPENNRVRNVHELIRIADKFKTVSEFLQYVDRTVVEMQGARKRPADADLVTLSTIHRAKGLEWPVVYVIGVADGIFPHAKAELSEEWRLFYVACTRAKRELVVSAPGGSRGVLSDVSGLPRFVRQTTLQSQVKS